MALIVLASDKGSPGVTTSAVALAGVWPRRAVLAECDPSGGDLVYRSSAEQGGPLMPNLGMLSLATAARHGLSENQLGDHMQRVHGSLEVIVGLATGDQAVGLSGLWSNLGRAFDSMGDADVIADCGRLGTDSPTLELIANATLVVLVARTSAEQIAHVRDRALSLVQRVGGGNSARGGLGVPVGVVLVVDPKRRARVTAQVDELFQNSGLPVRVLGCIADDPDGAALINGVGRGRLDKSMLVRSAREVSQDVFRRFVAVRQDWASEPEAAPSAPAAHAAPPPPQAPAPWQGGGGPQGPGGPQPWTPGPGSASGPGPAPGPAPSHAGPPRHAPATWEPAGAAPPAPPMQPPPMQPMPQGPAPQHPHGPAPQSWGSR